MPGVITTCAKCGAQYSWNTDFQEYPDCPKCGYNAMKVNRAKREKCSSAAERGDLAGVKQALSDPDVCKNLNAGPLTILHHAVSGNQIEVVKYLLSLGANPNAAYPKAGNETPLHTAASKGFQDIAKVLIDGGARVDAKDSNGRKPIDIATNDATIALLQPYDSKMSMVKDYFAAVKNGDIEKVDDFLNKGIDPDLKDPDSESFGPGNGSPALNYACGFGRLPAETGRKLAEILIKHGGDVNICRNARISALHDAVMRGRADIAELLIKNGANVNIRDLDQQTPLHQACDNLTGPKEGRLEVVKLLLANGPDINACDEDGRTPIHLAALYFACKKTKDNPNYSDEDFMLLKVMLDAGGTLHEGDLPVEWVGDKNFPNPDIVAFLKSYVKQNPTSAQATGPILRRRKESTVQSSVAAQDSTMDKKPKEGCFIATACYGSEHSPEVVLLRNFRDSFLLRRSSGRLFVRLYYLFSPPAAEVISRHHQLRALIRALLLAPLVLVVSFFYKNA